MSLQEKDSHSNASSVESSPPAPSFTAEEESKLVRKMDLRIMSVVTLLYLANFIDRTNIGNARVAGLEGDLGLVGYQYNIALSVFYIFYAFFEVPSNLALKRYGADKWIPLLVVGFGLMTFLTAFVRNFGGFVTIRAFLGIFEGGMMPGITYYLSKFYKRHELVLRVTIFVSGSSLGGAFGGLLATAILNVPQLRGVPAGIWRNIFLIEGVITMGLGIIGIFLLPSTIQQAGFLSQRDKEVAVARMTLDGSAQDSDFTKNSFSSWGRAFRSLNTWICGISALLVNISVQGIALFMPTLLRGMGYSPIRTQLMTVPPYVTASVWSIFIAYMSFRTRLRAVWVLSLVPFAIAGTAIIVGTGNDDANYAAAFLITMGVFPQGTILLAWATNNTAPDAVRAVSSAMVVAIGTIGPIITSWIYLPGDAPRYRTANSVQVGAQALLTVLVLLLTAHNIRENRLRKDGKRNYRLDADPAVVANLGNRHPDFKMAL